MRRTLQTKVNVETLAARHSPRRLHKGEKIVNGQVVNIEDVPYQVGLRDSESDFFCGGAIVGRKVVFTAAHCVTVIPTSTPSPGVQVFAGAQRIGDPAAQIHDVQTIHVHPNWDYENLNYDFAVLILQTNLEYTNRIKPVPVTTKKIKVGKPVRLSGYGRNEYGVITGDLRVAMMMIVKRRNCQENLGDDLRMTKAMICLESEDGQSACNVSGSFSFSTCCFKMITVNLHVYYLGPKLHTRKFIFTPVGLTVSVISSWSYILSLKSNLLPPNYIAYFFY